MLPGECRLGKATGTKSSEEFLNLPGRAPRAASGNLHSQKLHTAKGLGRWGSADGYSAVTPIDGVRPTDTTGATGAGCVVPAATLEATASLAILSSPIQLTLAAQLSATGWLSGRISPYTPLSPESLAAKIEDTLGPRLDDIEQKVGITLALAAG